MTDPQERGHKAWLRGAEGRAEVTGRGTDSQLLHFLWVTERGSTAQRKGCSPRKTIAVLGAALGPLGRKSWDPREGAAGDQVSMLSLVLAGCVTLASQPPSLGGKRSSPSEAVRTHGVQWCGCKCPAPPLAHRVHRRRAKAQLRLQDPTAGSSSQASGGLGGAAGMVHTFAGEGEPPARPSQLTQVMGSKLR